MPSLEHGDIYLMLETRSDEQQMIDEFIRRNKKMLKRMDEHNREHIPMYLRDYDCLTATDSYERKRAVRRILEHFLSDWG